MSATDTTVEYFTTYIPETDEAFNQMLREFNALDRQQRTNVINRILINTANRRQEPVIIVEPTDGSDPLPRQVISNKRRYVRLTDAEKKVIIDTPTPPGRLFEPGIPQELAELFGISVGVVYNIKEKGLGRAKKKNNSFLFRKEKLVA